VGLSSSSSAHDQSHPRDGDEMTEKEHHRSHPHDHAKKDKRHRRKAMTSVILDQLGDAIGAVALKNSKFNQELGSLHSARKLARKLFATLSDVHPPRNLIVSGIYQPSKLQHYSKLILLIFRLLPIFPNSRRGGESPSGYSTKTIT
jgi:hypothetical protein